MQNFWPDHFIDINLNKIAFANCFNVVLYICLMFACTRTMVLPAKMTCRGLIIIFKAVTDGDTIVL